MVASFEPWGFAHRECENDITVTLFNEGRFSIWHQCRLLASMIVMAFLPEGN
jgi:hypothetical protein